MSNFLLSLSLSFSMTGFYPLFYNYHLGGQKTERPVEQVFTERFIST